LLQNIGTKGCFYRFTGTKEGTSEAVKLVESIVSRNQGGKVEFASTPEEQHDLWSARKEALWSMLSLRKGDEEVWSTDVAVPLSRLPDIIEVSKKEMDELGLFASILGHIGDGNFHESILYDASNPEERKKVEGCVKRMVHRALEMEGTCTGEHSIGIGKKRFLVDELGLDTISVMQKLKASLDPYWIMNPGKIFDHPEQDHIVGH
jgi:D-lactate dehydrogenase (cytochrome)